MKHGMLRRLLATLCTHSATGRSSALLLIGTVATITCLTSCGQAVPNSSVSTAPAKSVSPSTADVQVVKIIPFANDPLHERVSAATVLPEGGFLALTTIRGGSSFAYK